ncbi:MAG: rod shape-determining protein MreD [Elusimicrobia bacterium]|nr:rod shape-determining protein MreD [Elusimicrobiota bacterium]
MRYLRGVGVFVGAVLVQWWWPSRLPIFGFAPQVLLVMTIAAASTEVPAFSLTVAFLWGLVLDTIGVHLFGGNALALTGTAYLVWLVKRQADVSNPLSQAAFTGLISFGYALFLAALALVFKGEAYWPGWGSFFVTPVFNAIAAPIGFEMLRRYMKTPAHEAR